MTSGLQKKGILRFVNFHTKKQDGPCNQVEGRQTVIVGLAVREEETREN